MHLVFRYPKSESPAVKAVLIIQTINALTALRAHLPAEVTDKLDTKPHR